MLSAIVKNKKCLSDKILLKDTFSFQRCGLTDFSKIFTSGSLKYIEPIENSKIVVTELVSEINPSISLSLRYLRAYCCYSDDALIK